MPQNDVTCEIEIGSTILSFNNVLRKFAHYRGFDRVTSYVVIEIKSPNQSIITDLMNFSQFRVRYGGSLEDLSDWFTFEVLYADNSIKTSNVFVKIVGVEPGFMRLAENVVIKSFPNQAISDVVSKVAGDMNTSLVRQTTGRYTFLQTNISDLQFLKCMLLPISFDSSGEAPFLFTVDHNKLVWKPPTLNKNPIQTFLVDATIDTNVKSFTTMNRSILGDYVSGGEYTTYGYDPIRRGVLHKTDQRNFSTELINKIPYESKFKRSKSLPYDQQWMINAYNKNELARSSFSIMVNAVVIGHHLYNFDEIYKFTLPLSDNAIAEYSGNYYGYSVIHSLAPRQYTTHLNLRTNSFMRRYEV